VFSIGLLPFELPIIVFFSFYFTNFVYLCNPLQSFTPPLYIYPSLSNHRSATPIELSCSMPVKGWLCVYFVIAKFSEQLSCIIRKEDEGHIERHKLNIDIIFSNESRWITGVNGGQFMVRNSKDLAYVFSFPSFPSPLFSNLPRPPVYNI